MNGQVDMDDGIAALEVKRSASRQHHTLDEGEQDMDLSEVTEPMRVNTMMPGFSGAMAGLPHPLHPTGMPGAFPSAFQEGVDIPAANALIGAAVPPPEWGNNTTVMMRNLPNKYTQRMLLTELNHTGFLGTFDFLYLPIDPETNANRGYSFLNFIDPGFAWMFKMSYEGRKMNRFNSNKVVSIMPATLQGFEANYAHYAAARVNRGDPAARPLFLREPNVPVPSAALAVAGSKRAGRRRGGNENGGQPPGDVTSAVHKPQQQSFEGLGAPAYFNHPDDDLPSKASAGAGAPLGDAQARGSSNPPEGQNSMVPKFCPHCGGAIQPMFQFCPHCGAGLDFSA